MILNFHTFAHGNKFIRFLVKHLDKEKAPTSQSHQNFQTYNTHQNPVTNPNKVEFLNIQIRNIGLIVFDGHLQENGRHDQDGQQV